MRPLLCVLLLAAAAAAQDKDDVSVGTRTGLLADKFENLNPLGSSSSQRQQQRQQQSNPRTVLQRYNHLECCCIQNHKECSGSSALTDEFYDIGARSKNPAARSQANTTTTTTTARSTTKKSSSGVNFFGRGKRSPQNKAVDSRIVNVHGDRNDKDRQQQAEPYGTSYVSVPELDSLCDYGYRSCCYNPSDKHSCPNNQKSYCSRGFSVIDSFEGSNQIYDIDVRSGSSVGCGVRQASYDLRGPNWSALSSPGEYPWTCMILKDDNVENNQFVGTCVIVDEPENFPGRTRKILTVSHRLQDVKPTE